MGNHIRALSLAFPLLTFVLLALGVARAASANWKNLTSLKEIRTIHVNNDTLFVATGGGMLVIASPDTPPEVYLNTDGLGTVDIYDIVTDATNTRWIAADGQLVAWNNGATIRYPVSNAEGPDRLRSIADDGDVLWIGSEFGLLLFHKQTNGGLFLDRYGITLVNAFPVVYDVLIDGNDIWLATSVGLARGDKRVPNLLKSPANWQMITTANYPDMTVDSTKRVVRFENRLFFSTVRGLHELLVDSLGDTSITPRLYLPARRLNDMRVDQDTLFMYFEGNLRAFSRGSVSNIFADGVTPFPRTGARTSTHRWYASNEGLWYGTIPPNFPYTLPGLPFPALSDLAFGASGLSAGFGVSRRYGVLADSTWTVYPVAAFSEFTTLLVDDQASGVWIGSWGDGLRNLKSAGDTTKYISTNSSLTGISPGSDYVVIRGLAVDNGVVYAACYLAHNGYPISFARTTDLTSSGWDSLGFADGITNNLCTSLDAHDGQVAMGTESNGLFLIRVGDDPFDKRDDKTQHLRSDNALLASNTVRVVRFSSQGELWAGTNFGLSRFDPGIDRFIDINTPPGFGPDITAIEFDARDNIWVGATTGLARIDATSGQIEVYTPQNSGLLGAPSSLALDRIRNDLYVGTGLGISIFLSGLGVLTESVDAVHAYPNPARLLDPTDRVSFNFLGQATVRIFTVAGDPVAEFPVNAGWNGLNGDGRAVSAGVYLFVVTNEAGEVGRGKILLVRE